MNKSYLDMLADVGITSDADVTVAMEYAATVSDVIVDHTNRIQDETLARNVTAGCLEYFIDVYERQFVEMDGGEHQPPDENEPSFSIILMSNNVVLPTEQAVARRFMRDLTAAMLDTAKTVIGHERKAVAIVLAAARKMLDGMKP